MATNIGNQSLATKMAEFIKRGNQTTNSGDYGLPPKKYSNYGPLKDKWYRDKRQEAEARKYRWAVRLANQNMNDIRKNAASHSGPPTKEEIAAIKMLRERAQGQPQPKGRVLAEKAVSRAKKGLTMIPAMVPRTLKNGATLKNYTQTGAVYSDGTHLDQKQLRNLVYNKPKANKR